MMPVKSSSSIMSSYVPLWIFHWRRPRRPDHFWGCTVHRLVLSLKLINSIPPCSQALCRPPHCLKDILRGQLVSITAHETTDVRGHSILNVIETIRGRPYLIKMDACNHWTFSRAIIQSVTDVGIVFDEVIVVVADIAATARKHTYHEWCIISHVCKVIAHVVNLAAEVFHHYSDFKHTSEVKLPPVPVSSCWNSWFEIAMYHATRVHLYEGFYRAEKGVDMAHKSNVC